eukprot:jgi/Orpsp1_1/1175927/evm.model.c7180000055750.1
MKNITAKKMEYQLEIEELNQVRASLESKIVELKKHQIYTAKYKIIIIDLLQNQVVFNDQNILNNYQFQLEVYNMTNINEKYDMIKTYKEFFKFHSLLKLKYKNIPDFPTCEYIIYKKKFFRDHLISRKALPMEKRETSFNDIYKIHSSELVQELENYINLLSNIPMIGENPDFIRFVTYPPPPSTPPPLPSRGPHSASLVPRQSLPEVANEHSRRKSFNDKVSSNGSLSSMMSFIKPSRSQRKSKSSSFSFSRLNEKINDKINDKLFNPNSSINSGASRLRNLAPTINISSSSSDISPISNGSSRGRYNTRYDTNNYNNNNSIYSNGINNNNNNNNNNNDYGNNYINDNRNVSMSTGNINTVPVFNYNYSNNNSNTSSRNSSTADLLSKRNNEQLEIYEVQSETDSVKSSKTNDEPVNINMSQEAIDMILECIICLVEEIFQLNNPDQWMRQKAFQVVKQVALKSFSAKINNILCAFLGKVFSEETPSEEKGKKKKKEISYEEKERIKYHAKNLLLTSNKIPLHYISKVVGTSNTQNGMVRLFDMFQVTEFNRHLMCAILQSVIICVFDNDDIEM